MEQFFTLETARTEIKRLKALIKKYNYSYFFKNEFIVTDEEYDLLFQRLKTLEKNFSELNSKSSLTQSLGINKQQASKFKLKHRNPMLSLNKCFTQDELNSFMRYVKEQTNSSELEFVGETKINGIAFNLLKRAINKCRYTWRRSL